jgi:hypothetical protein
MLTYGRFKILLGKWIVDDYGLKKQHQNLKEETEEILIIISGCRQDKGPRR